ncbi:amino acid permease [Diplonema papillatum]|nr:amino acid permease [Diplonema papillatum]
MPHLGLPVSMSAPTFAVYDDEDEITSRVRKIYATLSSAALDEPPPECSQIKSVRSLGGLLVDFDQEPSSATAVTVSVSLFMTFVGTGVLAMPMGVRYAGVVGFALVVLVVGFCTTFGCYLTYRTLDIIRSTRSDVAHTGHKIYGRWGFRLALTLCLLDTWSGGVANLRAAAETLALILPGSPEPKTLVFVVAVLVWPLTLKEKFSDLRFVGYYAAAAIVFFVLSVFGDAAAHPHKAAQTLEATEWIRDPAEMLSTIGVIFFSFDCQVNLFPLYREMRVREGCPKTGTMMGPTVAAIILAGVGYMLIGYSGYSMYGVSTGGNILHNLEGYTMLKVVFASSVTLALPILLHEGNVLLWRYLLPEGSPKMFSSIAMMSTAALCAATMDFFTIFRLAGATAGVVFTSVVPPFFFLGAIGRHRLLSNINSIPHVDSEPIFLQNCASYSTFADDESPPRVHLLGKSEILASPQARVCVTLSDQPDFINVTPGVNPPPAPYSRYEIVAAVIYLCCGILAVPTLVLGV